MDWLVAIVDGELYIEWPEMGMFEETKEREVFDKKQFYDNSRTHLISTEVDGTKIHSWIYLDQISAERAKNLLEFIAKLDIAAVEAEKLLIEKEKE